MAILKKVENAGNIAFNKQILAFGEQTLGTTDLKFTYCDLDDTSIRPYGNLFSSFNFPITPAQKNNFFTSYTNNAFSYLNGITKFIVCEIPQNKYGELINGKTFKLSFPINSGATLTNIDCYGTYFLKSESDIDTKAMDKQYACSNPNGSFFGIEPSSNVLSSSNMTFLFSNQIAKPKLNLSYTSLLNSSYTLTTSSTLSSNVLYQKGLLNLSFLFQNNKRYKITFSNHYNNIKGYETSSNIFLYDNYSTLFNLLIGTDSFKMTNPLINNLAYDSVNGRSIRSILYTPSESSNTFSIKSEFPDLRAILNKVDIKIEEITIVEGEWNRWTTTNKFIPSLGSTTGKVPARFSSSEDILYDRPIGLLYLDKGFAVITDPYLVSNFAYNYSGATSSGYDGVSSGSRYSGNTNFTQIYFNDTAKANCIYNSIYTEFIQSVTCIAAPNEFYISNNPTFIEVYGEGGEDNVSNDPVFITEIGLYNQFGELIAIAKTSEPIPKDKFNFCAFDIQLKL